MIRVLIYRQPLNITVMSDLIACPKHQIFTWTVFDEVFEAYHELSSAW